MIKNRKTKLQYTHRATELRKRCNVLEEKVTAISKLEEELRETRNYAEGIVKAVRHPILVLSSELKVLFANQSFYETFKVEPKNTLQEFIFNLGNRQWDIPELQEFLQKILPRATELIDYEVTYVFPNIGRKIILLNAWEIPQKKLNLRIIFLSMEDITARRELEIRVQQLAFYDELTKLPNRRLLNDRLGHALEISQRSGRYCALIFLDLDNFKPLNDKHGHAVGDLLLIEVATRLNNCIRKMDTAARIGGDEFVVILSELSQNKADSALQAEAVAAKIRTALSTPYALVIKHMGKPDEIIEHHGSASVGVILFFNHDVSQEEILELADKAMYQEKQIKRAQLKSA